jgi:hypothetical protein
LAACGDGRRPADPAARESLPVDERVFTDASDFLAGYWQRPIPLQGEAPEGFSTLESSLDPGTCGGCHPVQLADWNTTLHSGAYSPGLSGQLVNMATYPEVRVCLVCHAPLSEQLALVPDTTGALVSNPYFEKSLQRQGMVCAACHVRGWRRYGPPRRDGSLSQSPDGAPHGGATRTTFFEDSRFCAGCHQFEFPAPNGKSLQNTYTEWRESRYAEEGLGCQGCHMPDRRHLWRGIHDSTMVANGVTIEWVSSGRSDAASIRVENSGTGHRFPTYVTPRVVVRIELLDRRGAAIDGAGVEAVIERRVEFRGNAWVELYDTRLAPDSSLVVTADIGSSGAQRVRGVVVVYPDHFYEGMFAGMLAGTMSDTSRVLINEAHRRAGESSFVIFDDTVEAGSGH